MVLYQFIAVFSTLRKFLKVQSALAICEVLQHSILVEDYLLNRQAASRACLILQSLGCNVCHRIKQRNILHINLE